MRIGSLFGIDIKIDFSWIFVFALVAWSFSNPAGPLRLPSLDAGERAALGVFASLLFFGSVLVHELAHSLVARHRGIRVSGITLFIFGGVSAIEGEPSTAPAEAWISGVGPLTSLVLGVLFSGLAYTLTSPAVAPFRVVFAYLGFANVALAIFNILPAYPLDGGRVMHALIWKLTGDRDRATKVTVGLGRIFATMLIVFGALETLAADFGAGLWTTFIGWYLLQAGTMEQSRVKIAHALDGHPARDLVVAADLRLPANATASEALAYLRDHHARAVPVFVGDSFLGVVRLEDVLRATPSELERSYVTTLMTRAESLKSMPASASAGDLVREMAEKADPAYTLTGDRGEFVGIVTRDSVMQWLSAASHAA